MAILCTALTASHPHFADYIPGTSVLFDDILSLGLIRLEKEGEDYGMGGCPFLARLTLWAVPTKFVVADVTYYFPQLLFRLWWCERCCEGGAVAKQG